MMNADTNWISTESVTIKCVRGNVLVTSVFYQSKYQKLYTLMWWIDGEERQSLSIS